MSMIKTVAVALYTDYITDNDYIDQAVSFDELEGWAQEKWRAHARTAIKAMREPNQDMTAPLVEPGDDRTHVVRTWKAMIDAALEYDQ